MNSIRYEKDANNIVHLVFDNPNESANLLNNAFRKDFSDAISRLEGESELAGIILRSAKSTFFAGADLKELVRAAEHPPEELWANFNDGLKRDLRRLETMGKPVAALINGAAMGGGWEMCLCAMHRIALDSPKVVIGLPEVNLGLLPGGGGVVKMVRLLGVEAALPYLLEGKTLKPQQAHELGLVHELAATPEEMIDKATTWIQANPEAQQPYDVKGYKIPGGTPSHPGLAQRLSAAPAVLRQKTKGCYPAPEAILSTAVESAQVDVDNALRIETRYFIELARGAVAGNMINTFWFQLNEIKAGVSRPDGFEPAKVAKVGVLGAGMMGSGIAWACASKGIDVVLKDVSMEQAEKGKAYSAGLVEKRVGRGRMSEEDGAALLARIQPSTEAGDLADCDLVIEAVFEDKDLKAKVTQEAEAALGDGAIFASNTSTLPITGLAEASRDAGRFIGLHFFSPVDKMPLVEIISGEKTAPETLARAYDFVQQIAKTPIVVNDSRGFYTSRVIGTYMMEGVGMLAEGIPAAMIENAAVLSGFPVGPLNVMDEVSLSLSARIREQTRIALEAEGKPVPNHPANAVQDWMLEQNRAGKAAGAGFYEYPQGGRKHLWPGLAERFGSEGVNTPLQDVKDRFLFIQALESVRCLDEGVIEAAREANIGSIFGIGYPAWTGGALQFINGYGMQAFVDRAWQLAEAYGARFEPPRSLVERAERNEKY